MSWEVLQGDCRDVLPTLPEKSVNCCVTSPPYFGLRDYGTAQWVGGNPNCNHKPSVKPRTERPSNGLTGGKEYLASQEPTYRDTCGDCGASRVDRQIGLEPTPDEFVGEMVKVFREVRRVLRDDGTLWLNLGDSYGTTGGNIYECSGSEELASGGINFARPAGDKRPKNLLGIPWRVAFALQADGWYLRQDIIWAKPNPMPESVTDRCTKSHEYIFLMAKSERYFCDMDAIKEPASEATNNLDKYKRCGYAKENRDGYVNHLDPKSGEYRDCNGERNKRSVWTVASSPFSEAHFATFPPKLIEPCILAGCPVGGTVLDPFNGAGTTGLVSVMQGRNYVGIELNPEYIEMTNKRISEAVPLWAPEPVKVQKLPELFA